MSDAPKYKPGDRVVTRRDGYGRYEFGTVLGLGAERAGRSDGEPYLSVKWDGADAADNFVWPDMIALMPPQWQPKPPHCFAVAVRQQNGFVAASEVEFETADEALAAAKKLAVENRDTPMRVFALVPLVEVTAAPPIWPEPATREL
ncbi:MAG: hypothetical protein KA144_08145 [Xanthomonadaceae bacterium]|nr:hypothetical protein [Xanthomonadaceae bacterium]